MGSARGRGGWSRGFTLVELLVVIAIIAVLMSVLLPGLQKARLQAQRAACGAGLHQFGTAIQMYINDNASWLPTMAGPLNGGFASDEIAVPSDGWWSGTDANHPTAVWINYSFPDLWNHNYLNARRIAFCPAYDKGKIATGGYWFGWVTATAPISSATAAGVMGYQYLTWNTAQASVYYGGLIGQGSIKEDSAWDGKTTRTAAIMQDTVATGNPAGPQYPPYTAHGSNTQQEGGNVLKGDWSVFWAPFTVKRWAYVANGFYDYIDLSD